LKVFDMKTEANMGGESWNDEDKAIVAAVLGSRAFDYLISSSVSNECSIIPSHFPSCTL